MDQKRILERLCLSLLVILFPLLLQAANSHSIDLEVDSTQYLNRPDEATLDITGNMTIEAWVRFETQPSNATARAIAGKSGTIGGGNQSWIFIYSGTNYIRTNPTIALALSTNGSAQTYFDPGVDQTLTNGTWYHVAAVYTASTGVVEFFVNGASIGSETDATKTSIFNSTADFEVGSYDGVIGDGLQRMDGLMDDVRYWSSARTSSQIDNNNDTELCGTETNLVGYWQLNNDLLDLTTNNLDLTNNNSAVFSTTIPTLADASCGSGAYIATTTDIIAVGQAGFFSVIIFFLSAIFFIVVAYLFMK